MIGKGKGGSIVKGKPAYTLEFRNDKGKGKQAQLPGTLPDDDDAPDGWHERRTQQEAIHAAEDDGAGIGDFDDDEVRHWREPDPDEMFLPRSRVPGETPPSGLEDFEPYSPDSFSDDDGDDRDDEDEPEEPGEATMASPAALQVVDMSPTKVIQHLLVV